MFSHQQRNIHRLISNFNLINHLVASTDSEQLIPSSINNHYLISINQLSIDFC